MVLVEEFLIGVVTYQKISDFHEFIDLMEKEPERKPDAAYFYHDFVRFKYEAIKRSLKIMARENAIQRRALT